MPQVAVDELVARVVDNVGNVIVGKRNAVELVFLAMLGGGHALIEDVPGVGKTSLVQALARSVACSFGRIQFTPDTLPADVTGYSLFSQKTGEFEFRPGAVMAQVVLADEINRTSPKTQSSLLEAMQEGQVTVDGKSYRLPEPFMVLATQNPVEFVGTFPLPEAQLDRFFMKVAIGYPQADEEAMMLSRFSAGSPLCQLLPVSSPGEILAAAQVVREVHVSAPVAAYAVAVAQGTRTHPDVTLGVSPRGLLALSRAAQALAAARGRDFATPDDVRAMAVPTLAHRIRLRHEARVRGARQEGVVADVIQRTPVPVAAQ